MRLLLAYGPWRSGLLAVCLLLGTGCSLLLKRDGAVSPPPPSVVLTPDAPTTVDSLLAAVPAASDGQAYRFVWRRFAGADTVGELVLDTGFGSASTSTLDAAETARDERWQVVVTTRFVDGNEVSSPDSAEVEILNTLPTLQTAWPSSYAPIEGERVAMTPGAVVDPDTDDALSLRFVWSRVSDDTELFAETIGVSGVSILEPSSLPQGALQVGDALQIDVYPSDGEEGAPLRVGPLEILADITRWRALLPDRDDTGPIAYDAAHRRFIFVQDSGAVWEARRDELSRGEGFSELFPQGEGLADDDQGGVYAVYDAPHRRVVVLGKSQLASQTTTYALSVAQRGGERWLPVNLSGVAPPPASDTSTWFFDPDARRVYAYLAGPDGPNAHRLWSLDLSEEDVLTWRQHTLDDATSTGVFFPSVTPDPTRSGVFLFFGGGSVGDGGEPLLAPVYELNVAQGRMRPVEVAGEPLFPPARMALGATHTRVQEQDIVVGAGFLVDEDGQLHLSELAWRFSVDDLTFEPLPDAPVSLGLMSGVTDEETQDVLLWRFPQGGFDLVALGSNGVWRALFEHGVTLPPSLEAPQATLDNGALEVTGGRVRRGLEQEDTYNAALWKYNLAGGGWQAPVTLANGTPRAGVLHPNSVGSEAFVWGGRNETGLLTSPEGRDDEEWFSFSFVSERVAREGVAVFPRQCVAPLRAFGGVDATGAYPIDAYLAAECNGGDTDCVWETRPGPSARAWAGVGRSSGDRVALYGGVNGSSELADLYVLQPCAVSDEWTQITDIQADLVHGTPGPRWGHTLTYMAGYTDPAPSYLLLGGAIGPVSESDAWVLTEVTNSRYQWTKLQPVGEGPRPRRYHAAVWDDPRDRLLVYGGDQLSSDMWELRVREEFVATNGPPTLHGLGLENYSPALNEVIRAVVGPVTDPENDAVNLDYAWTLVRPGMADTVLATGSVVAGDEIALDLRTVPVVAGAGLTLSVTPTDGNPGQTRTVGPATLMAATTRWRAVLPNRYGYSLNRATLFDANHDRFLFVGQGETWEVAQQFDGSSHLAQLHPQDPEDTPTSAIIVAMLDRAGQRIVTAEVSGAAELLIEDRGQEEWNPLTVVGTPPADVSFASVFYRNDGSAGFALVGLNTRRLFRATIDTPGELHWTELPYVDESTPGLGLLAVLVEDPSRPDVFFAFGGVGAGSSVVELDASGETARVTDTGFTLPVPTAQSAAFVDPRDNRILFSTGTQAWRFDPTVDPMGPAFEAMADPPIPLEGFRGFYDADTRTTWFTPASNALHVVALDESDVWSAPLVYGQTLPPRLSRAQAVSTDTLRLTGGVQAYQTSFFQTIPPVLNANIWTFDPTLKAWSMENGSGGTPRIDVVYGQGTDPGLVVGGHDLSVRAQTPAGVINAPERLVGSSWQAIGTPAGAPTAAQGVMLAGCNNGDALYLGGRDSAGTFLTQRGSLTCGASSCTANAVVGPALPALAWPAVALHETGGPSTYAHVIFGGRGSGGAAFDSVWQVLTCNLSLGALSRSGGITVGGRWGHTLTAVGTGRFVMTGGLNGLGGPDATVMRAYEMTVSGSNYTWRGLAGVEGPPRRAHHAAVWSQSSVPPRLYIYGGEAPVGSNEEGSPLSDMWELLQP